MTIQLTHPDQFKNRHIGPSESETSEMLKELKLSSLDQLIDQTIPKSIRLDNELNLPDALNEAEMLQLMKSIADKNTIYRSFIGMGYYNTILPTVIQRNVLENPGWYTQYTPYQAEIAQGRLEALLNFQTMVADLTGLEIANSSLLDEGTAAGEAMTLMFGVSKNNSGTANRNKFLVSSTCFPQTIDVVKTRALPLDIEIVVTEITKEKITDEYFGVLLQYPDKNGNLKNPEKIIQVAKEHQLLVAVATDLMALTMIKSPGSMGADIAVGSSQRFGVPMGFGGPHAAFFATKDTYKRLIPGRIIGVSVDSHGNRALRMALQTREQHIRRDKATSNICTAQVLLAIIASMYAVYHGPKGLRKIAERIHGFTTLLSDGLTRLGYTVLNSEYFDTITVDLGKKHGVTTDQVKAFCEGQEINLRFDENEIIGISLDETFGWSDLNNLLSIFAELVGQQVPFAKLNELSHKLTIKIPDNMKREVDYLTHPVFNSYHSETEMMRYIKSLENKDLSLNTSMIPLGSCTMKLNATTEMIPVTWAEFASIHPFAPADQVKGYTQLIEELSEYLCEVTGFSGVSFQPNSGAQGEYAGLMAIRSYLISIGQGHRRVSLIPSSAHGTNPASAVMAGMQVVVVNCDELGNIDVEDLKKKAELHKDNLASLMVTYPSTHGVFEETIREICDIVHKNGGQVYMDGANMNAQVGLTSPNQIGADVCHLNLHKTFCIPHGGGGPGVGPIAVAEHLVPFLPTHGLVELPGSPSGPSVSSAPYGSALILVIPYAYIRMMGGSGLKRATEIAILNANYIQKRLSGHYETLYVGTSGRVAHECIFDLRPFKSVGIESEDVAKRLMDYGYHAPTVSFPVAGTIMVEPTESESKAELDKFIEALISIRSEIQELIDAKADTKDNVLKNAPHTAESVISSNWSHTYSREKAVYPLPYVKSTKFWPSVGRVNNAHGDRNLICVCPPIELYMEESVS